MATLKSKKMVRGRDLKTPLAASTMDKAKGNGKKGGPGDPPKKKNKTKKYSGDPNLHTKITYKSTGKVRHFRKGELEKLKNYGSAMGSGKLKKKVLPDGRIHYTYKKD